MGPRASGSLGGAWLRSATFLLLLLALAGAVGGVEYLPTHDGPQHVFAAHAAAHLDHPGSGWQHWLTANVPPTNHGFTALFAPFDAWLPWPTALRIALTLSVLLWAGGAIAFVTALARERVWLALPLAAAACQWTLYMGFFSFHAASGVGLWVLALALRRAHWSLRTCVELALLLLAQALMHVVPALLTGCVLLALAASRATRGERLRALARVVALGTPAALVALAVLRIGLTAIGDHNEGIGNDVILTRAPWWSIARCFTAGPAWRAWLLPLLALAGGAFALRRARGGLSPEDRALAASGALLLLAGLLLPLHLRAWDFFSVRFLPLGVAVLVAIVPLERLRDARWQRAVGAALALWSFAATGWAWQHHRSLQARMAPALAGLDAPISRDGLRLPIVMDAYLGEPPATAAEVPYVVPALNLGALYAASQGGVVPYSFTLNPVLHHALRRDEAWASLPGAVDRRYAIDLARTSVGRDPLFRSAVLAYVAAHATPYQDVVLWGRPEDAQQLREMGYRLDYESGGLAIAHFEGCPLTVRVENADEDATLTVGWHPAQQVTHRYPLVRGRLANDGSRELPLRQSCGSVWLGLEEGGLACQGADASGRLLVRSTRHTPRVVCRAQRMDLAVR
ncbi:MAG: hypothetical protein JRH16_13570 [Deltaproteobacteria bacterium]|nr:hypothetical protein [Deltaproteobacteria bacterium]